MSLSNFTVAGSAGHDAPPIKAAPRRLQRSRKRGTRTAVDAIYVGRPTLWSNPFAGRPRIGHARSVILYGTWISEGLPVPVLERCTFSDAEIGALHRWREQLVRRLPSLTGRNLECWCPLTSAWCHANTLIRLANR